MTSIVITPFDSEHTEELKDFLWKVIEQADFAECMPPSVRLVDVRTLEAERKLLINAMRELLAMPEYDGTQPTSVARRAAKQVARNLLQSIEETE
jgi:hypothetical protein